MSGIGLGILAFFVVLIPLVIIHELGHFFAAKSVGITVLEFGVGMPPRAIKLFTIGDTEYTLNWLPLGGFVRPFGEDFVKPKDPDQLKADLEEIEGRHIADPKSVFEAGPWERMWFMAAGPIFNFIAAFLIFVIVAIIGQPYAVFEVSVAQIFPGSPAEEAGLESGDIIREVDGVTIESITDFEDATENKDSYSLIVERDGEVLEEPIIVTPAPFSVEPEVDVRLIVYDLDDNAPAVEAGIEQDDVLLAVDGELLTGRRMFNSLLEENAGQEVILTVRRNGEEELEIPVQISEEGSIGISYSVYKSKLEHQVVLTNLLRDEPADEAGLELDDIIVSVNGESITSITMLSEYTDEREEREVVYGIYRDGEYLEYTVTPVDIDGQARIGIRIGEAPLEENLGATLGNLEPEIKTEQADSIGDAFATSAESFGRVMELIVMAPVLIIRGDISGEAARPASPVAISQIGGELIRETQEVGELYPILQFTALISIALAITNLLPIPGLDGGRILFVIIELLRGKPMAPEREGFVHMMGLIFLLSLVAVVIVWDIVDPIDLDALR